VEAPFAIRLDRDNGDFRLFLSDDLVLEIGTHTSRDDNLVYVDRCEAFEARRIFSIEHGGHELCFLVSLAGKSRDLYGKVGPDFRVDRDLRPREKTHKTRTIFARLDDVMYPGAEIRKLAPFGEKGQDSLVDISGGVGQSAIRWRGTDTPLLRGITFFGRNPDGSLERLAFKDFCDAAETPDVPEELARALAGQSPHDRVFYAAADSAFCEDKAAFDTFVASLPPGLALASLGFREPIFAMVENGRETHARSQAGGRVVIK
jgi:hypothetical protein